MLGSPEAIVSGWERLQVRVLRAVLIKLIARAERPPTPKVQNLDLGQGLEIFSSLLASPKC